MNEEQLTKILLSQLTFKYATPKELMYSKEIGLNLSPFDYRTYLDYLDEKVGVKEFFKELRLKPFNSKHIFYSINNELLIYNDRYIELLREAIGNNKLLVSESFTDVINQSRIYSEIEGTLNVENVPTTRKRLRELIEKDLNPVTKNDIIIKNMDAGIKFVYSLPSFTKENLLKLYKILSEGCLKKGDEIKPGNYYRDDEVEIDTYSGCPTEKVSECMDSLFSFVEDQIANGKPLDKIYLPHICHYYILYIHPYFDYNGRTARMVSLWINLLANDNMMPPLISEAINQNKNQYYKAISDTRDSRNDLTYFLHYLFKTTIDYILSYQDLELIDQYAKNQGTVLTETELNYIKRVLVTYKGKFTYQNFIKNCQIEITKQGAFKILNKFVSVGILNTTETKSKAKLFDINKEIVKYTGL